MSVRENIASNIKTVIDAISSPDVKLCTRQPFELEELSQQQYPAVIVQTSEENRDDSELGSGARTRHGTIDFVILGFVKGSDTNIDTLRNQLITAIETALESDITISQDPTFRFNFPVGEGGNLKITAKDTDGKEYTFTKEYAYKNNQLIEIASK